MAYATEDGTEYLSYGELTALAKELGGNGAGLSEIFEGQPMTNDDAQAILASARVDASTPRAHSLIDTGLTRLQAAA